jgi:hypothetical protein
MAKAARMVKMEKMAVFHGTRYRMELLLLSNVLVFLESRYGLSRIIIITVEAVGRQSQVLGG